MKNKILLLMIVGQLAMGAWVNAQNVVISNTSTPVTNPSAVLDISSTTLGLLIPRPTSTPTSPANGLMFFNATTNAVNVNTGTSGSPVFYSLLSSNLSSPLIYTTGTGVGTSSGALSIQAAASGVPGYLTSTDYGTFNGKQPYLNNSTTLNTLGFVKATTSAIGNTVITYDPNTYISAVTGTVNYIPKYASSSSLNGTSLLYDNGTNVAVNTAGVAGTSTLQVSGSFATAILSSATSPTTGTWATVNLLIVTAATTITLPTAAGITGRIYTIKNNNVATFNVAAISTSEKIDGAATYALSAAYKFVTVQSDGANWYIIANN